MPDQQSPARPPARTTDNMAMAFVGPDGKETRTLALPPGLTADEAITYAKQWQGPHETMCGVVRYR